MRVVLHVYNLPGTEAGGTQYATHVFASWLTSQGHDVVIVTQVERAQEIKGKYKVVRVRRSSFPLFGTLGYFVRVALLVRRLKADVFQEQGIFGLAPFVKLLSKARVVVYGRGGDVFGSSVLRGVFLRASLAFADVAVALTGHMKREMQKFWKREVLVVPNVTLNPLLPSRSYPEAWRWVSVGRLHQDKGVDTAIRALARVREKGWMVFYTCVGDGPARKDFERLAVELGVSDFVDFVGHVSHDFLSDVLLKCHLFVFPTSYPEGFPNALLDAFAAGLPVVTTTVSGIQEIVHKDLGRCVVPRDDVALASACEELMGNKEQYEAMSRAVLEEVEKYRPGNVYPVLINAFLQILRAR